ncbi:MAG: T9SS type A sorting domain-containing protein [Cyclobacteriaceae bacterium]
MGTIYATRDGGNTWQQDLIYNGFSALTIENNNIYATSTYATIYRNTIDFTDEVAISSMVLTALTDSTASVSGSLQSAINLNSVKVRAQIRLQSSNVYTDAGLAGVFSGTATQNLSFTFHHLIPHKDYACRFVIDTTFQNFTPELMFTTPSLITAVEEQTNSPYSIYPNPAKSKVMIQANDSNTDFAYEIHNMLGQIVMSGRIVGSSDVSLLDLSPGLYIITCTDSKNKFTAKLVKE